MFGYYYHNRGIENEVTVKDICENIKNRKQFEDKPKRSYYRLIYNKDEDYRMCHIALVSEINEKENKNHFNNSSIACGINCSRSNDISGEHP